MGHADAPDAVADHPLARSVFLKVHHLLAMQAPNEHGSLGIIATGIIATDGCPIFRNEHPAPAGALDVKAVARLCLAGITAAAVAARLEILSPHSVALLLERLAAGGHVAVRRETVTPPLPPFYIGLLPVPQVRIQNLNPKLHCSPDNLSTSEAPSTRTAVDDSSTVACVQGMCRALYGKCMANAAHFEN